MHGRNGLLRSLQSLAVAGAALFALSATPAAAQPTSAPASAPAPAASEVAGIVVTGSRIPRPNLSSISPIQVVTDQQFKLTGHQDVIDLLNTLPQEFQNNVNDFSNTNNPLFGPGGISTADLRGLGPQRTLVLVNGRRLGVGDANTQNNNPAPDLDQIPAAMIDRVDVVTGGASATYGSDAVAGVVNFILKHDFEGVQLDAQVGANEHDQHSSYVEGLERAKGFAIPKSGWDGRNIDASAIFGVNSPDGKGNVTAYFEYHDALPVTQGQRDFSACKVNAGNALNSGACSGSPNSNQWIIPGFPNGFSVVGNQLLPYPQANSVPPALFNSSPYQYLTRQDTRYIAGFEAHYDVSEHMSFYSEFSFMNDRTNESVAPSGSFEFGNVYSATDGGILVNCDNALASAQELSVLCGARAGVAGQFVDVGLGRRNIEGGARNSYYEHMNYRVVGGVRGDIADAWHYDVYGSYYYTSVYQANTNYLSISRMNNALDVVNVAGTPTCRSVVNGTDTKCVPWNIFRDGGVTPAAISYLNELGTEYGTVQEQIVEGDVTGDLGKYGIKSPWATDGVGLSAGVSYRDDTLNFAPDAAIGSGDLSGGGGVGTAINKALGVTEVYFETRIPVVQKAPFFEDLEIDGGYRYSSYTSGPRPNTFKIGGQWAPTSDFKFRASYQQAIRAPTIIELYNPAVVTQSNSFANGDPCGGASPLYTLAQCQNTGVTAGQYGHIVQCPATQCDDTVGGNVALKPEQANTYSVGGTVTPSFFKGFTASIDWWDIQQTGLVGTLAPDTILARCAASGSPSFCGLIHRSSSGALFGPSSLTTGGYVVGTSINIAAGETSGIDLQADYRLPLEDLGVHGMGSVSADFIGSVLLKQSTSIPGVTTYDCAGLFGTKCQTVNPKWRHTFRLTWNTPWNILASLQWRMIGATSLDTNSSQAGLSNGATNLFSGKMPDIHYLDLSAVWTIRTGLKLRAGVNNVLDQDPPLIASQITGTGTPNAYPTYDLLGRQVFVGVTANF